LYISAKISIKPNWEDLTKFANTSKNIDFEQNIIENDINEENSDKFEKMLEEKNTNTLLHNLLDVEQIVDNNNKSLTIAPSEVFDLWAYFKTHILMNTTFQHYFLVIQIHH
jgi:hypothetical protein